MRVILILSFILVCTASKLGRSANNGATKKRSGDHQNIGEHATPKMKIDENGNLRAVEDKDFWNAKCQAELADQLARGPKLTQAKNVIFFLGDGTGIASLTAGRMLKGQRTGKYELETMAWETFPYSAVIKTYNTNNQVTDSAASATAYLTGVKANQATIGVDANVLLADCNAMQNEAYHTDSILKNFQSANRSTGVVTTTRVTHASPAGNYANTAERHWENDDDINDEDGDSDLCDDIAEQLVLSDPGAQIKVILGGGRKKFMSKDMVDPEDILNDTGRRDDGKDLIQAWLYQKGLLGQASYVWNRTDLLAQDTASLDYLLGLFDYSHMAYAIDKDVSNPSLAEMTQAAIEILQKDDKGFFLFVEGGLIDKAHHLNEHRSAMEEVVEFDKAVQKALDMTSEEDTLIIVTADHSQPMTINGYSARGKDILGLSDDLSDVDMLPYSTLMYTNGPGYKGEPDGARPDPSTDGYASDHYAGAAAIPFVESNHNGEDVILYARGPHSHLFTGNHENAYIPHAVRYAACVGEGLSFCDP